jgi:hypothetical protein
MKLKTYKKNSVPKTLKQNQNIMAMLLEMFAVQNIQNLILGTLKFLKKCLHNRFMA